MDPTSGPKQPKTRPRRTNLALLVLVPVAIFTGLWANTVGTDIFIHPSVLHGMVALAILALTPWKSVIVRRGLHRRRRLPWASIALLVMVVVTLASGMMHAFGFRGPFGPLSLMQVHIGGALGALILVYVHYRSHPVRMRRTDVDRRAFLKTATLTGAAAAIWLGLEGALDALGLPGGERRFTGSHETSSFDPRGLPVTSWFNDEVQRIDPETWRLSVDRASLDLEDVSRLPREDLHAVLDCTSAWYSEQVWSGVRLDRLVTGGEHRSIVVRSQTGYARRFPTRDLERLWLVTHVGGQPLTAGHGFPARIVAPGRRGFWWVKWVVGIETSDVPWWVQLPFPIT